MRTLLIPIGNSLRRDDGIAHAVLERIDSRCDFDVRPVLQLTPEIAGDIARYDAVWFLDADAGATQLTIGAMSESPRSSSLTHVATPEQVIELSRKLFGFAGQAFVCRIPATDFSYGEGLTLNAEELADSAAREIGICLEDRCHSSALRMWWNH